MNANNFTMNRALDVEGVDGDNCTFKRASGSSYGLISAKPKKSDYTVR